MKTKQILGLAFVLALPSTLLAQATPPTSPKFKALKCPTTTLGQVWMIMDRDGGNRKVKPYLSSLGNGEPGTGMISSPPFIINTDKITFTVCGHNGRKGTREDKNYVELVGARKGEVLFKTLAPNNDAMQERSWDVKNLRGTQVRIELHDSNADTAFAWMGIGRIDAGSALKVDFQKGMPKDWAQPERKTKTAYELLAGGIPFQRVANAYTVIPNSGSVELPCGFAADRLYFLGCIANGGKPLGTYGGIEVHYKTGSPDIFPLMVGFTADDAGKLLSPCASAHLHPSADPYQPYLVIKPRKDVITKIRLVANPKDIIPRITAITCETAAHADTLMPLPATSLDPQEASWIEANGISAESLDLNAAIKAIRAAYKMPAPESPVGFKKHRLDSAFRSEGLAVADFNGDGKLDIAAGNVYYAAPDWKMVTIGEPNEFNTVGYSNAFLCYADDFNHDGKMDLLVVDFPGRESRWLENPGSTGKLWKKHLVIKHTGNENPAYLDVDGDGRRELVFMSGNKCAFARAVADPAQPWDVQVIANPGDPSAGHGLGVGDVNRDGHLDVLIPQGWWEGPASATSAPWKFHPAEFFGGAQLCVDDLDGDGDSDVLGSSAHDYGIRWCEQTPKGWKTHEIDNSISQTHAIVVADFNGDGLPDFVTGKRFWAHTHDIGAFQPSVLCWYEQKRTAGKPEWIQHMIDAQSGVGLQFVVVDLNGDNKLDIVTSNKNGVFYFEQTSEKN